MNIADRLTFFRIVVVPFIVVFFMIDSGVSGLSGDFFKILAAFLFILGAISDGMDGYYARKYKLVSNAGKLWDPVADKVLVSSTLITLVAFGYIPFYVTIIIIAREFFVTGIRLVALGNQKIIAASRVAKWKTGFQLAYIITIMVFISFKVLIMRYIPDNTWAMLFMKNEIYIIKILEYITLFFTLYSGYDYYMNNKECLK